MYRLCFRFVDGDYTRCNEFSLNGLFMSDIQISFLQVCYLYKCVVFLNSIVSSIHSSYSKLLKFQVVIEELENSFNKRFSVAQERKAKDIIQIKRKHGILLKHIDDLVTVCKGISLLNKVEFDRY